MKKHLRFIQKCIVFICILLVCIKFVYQIIVPKLFYQEMLPTTLTYTNFYNVEKNTIDVIFLGSSLAATSYVPQELYDHYGITSYNLSSEKQNPILSYYWIKESLRYQHPKALVMDLRYFFDYNDDSLSMREVYNRRALDYMKWSSVKREAIKTICELDESQSIFSFYFPNIRYHTRWAELTEDDFSLSAISEEYALMGFAPLAESFKIDGYQPYDTKISDEKAQMHPLMKAYLDKIVQLCKQEDISLILTNVPMKGADKSWFITSKAYADENELLFLDFNEKNIYEELQFDFLSDSYDGAHVNIWGAQKITNYIGNVLVSQYNIGGNHDEQWADSQKVYKQIEKDCALQRITDINEYLSALDDDRYSIFISAKGNYLQCLTDEIVLKLRESGLQLNLQTDPSKEGFYYYFAVLDGGKREEYIGYEERTYGGSIRNGLVTYDITGAGSIMIDGVERSMKHDGLNIVVYSNTTRKVVDSIYIEHLSEENTLKR